MINIVVASQDQHTPQIRDLFWEYLQWANSRTNEEFKVNFDIATMLEDDMGHLNKFMPPKGRLLLGYNEDQLAGIGCLKELTPEIGEIKRMYVCPEHRGKGLGRGLISRLLEEAKRVGYTLIRLDSAGFMKEAHQLYKTTGFHEIEAYEGSEIPKEFQNHWIFMEMNISENQNYK